MPTVRLTDKSVRSMKAPTESPQVDYWDDKLSGFGLRVSKSKKSWVLRYRFEERKRRITIGTYPTLPLADARDKAKDFLYQVEKGIDPAKAKAERKTAITFKELAEDYLERHAKIKKKSWAEDERCLVKEVIPKWGRWKAQDVERKDIRKLLDETVKRGAPVHANRLKTLIHTVFNFGIEKDLVQSNPCTGIKKLVEEKPEERVLSADEIRKVWLAMNDEAPDIRGILRLRILLAQRFIETLSMAWADLDLDSNWWTLPGNKTKNGRPHRVFITPLAKKILDEINGEDKDSLWVFPSPKDKSKHIFHPRKAVERVREKSGVYFTGRDLRRTAASQMASIGISNFIIDQLLNHIDKNNINLRHYNLYSYDSEKQEALLKWENHLRRIIAGEVTSSVVPIRPKASQAKDIQL